MGLQGLDARGDVLVPRRAGEPVAVLRRGQLVRRDAVQRACRRPGRGRSRPSPLGRLTWPACSVSVTSTGTSALPRLVVTRTRAAVGDAEPLRVGRRSCAARRSTSFLRQAGSRKIVLAVDERRSPAESTNGNSVADGGRRVAQRRRARRAARGSARLTRRSGVSSRRQVSSYSSTVKVTPERPREDRLEERLAERRALAGEAGAPHRVGIAHRAGVRRAPQQRRGFVALAERRAERLVEDDRRQRGEVGPLAHRLQERLREGGAALAAAAACSGARSSSRERADARAPGGGGSPARRACRAAARSSGARSWKTLRGNSSVKNVASHFSNCDEAGST